MAFNYGNYFSILKTKSSASGHTPTTKLYSQLRHYLSTTTATHSSDTPNTYVILISTGAFCPVHLQHIRLFDAARAHIHATLPNHYVVAGYISPSHDDYVRGKLGENHISATHRIAMANLAVAASEWVDVDAWEAMGVDYFVDFPSVAVELRERVREAVLREGLQVDKERIAVWFLAGADLVVRAGGGFRRLARVGIKTVCAMRVAPEHGLISKDNFVDYLKGGFGPEWRNDIVLINEAPVVEEGGMGLSSTLVRRRLREGGDIDGLVEQQVAAYLKEHRILDL
ncbi:hypothetical protein BC936DRAFT_136732 [Jimgerdemannia flammicorona]|uniref:Cytidyltransferase-like domain-containing protein n=1 Tax=Jimgerdemannia flammicorona TaxID=994334 RepID=A0A433CYX7_9FUNG|nr:hypothetical protein BC936DRAFT_136732 [Jimgerdemannia flammicorona]